MIVSVLICFYNDEKYIKKSVESILHQSYRNFEIVLIDDFSEDSSYEMISDLIKKNNRIRYFKNKKNYGLTKSLNIGLDKCLGDIVVRSDADDYSEINRLELIVKQFSNDPKLEFVFSTVNHINEKGIFIKKSKYLNKTLSYYLLKYFNVFTHGSSAFKTYNKFRYDEEIKLSQDYAMWLKEIKKDNFKIINRPLYNLRLHKKSISNNNKKKQIFYAIYAQSKYRYKMKYDFDYVKENYLNDKTLKSLFYYQLLIRNDINLFNKYKNKFTIFHKLLFALMNIIRK